MLHRRCVALSLSALAVIALSLLPVATAQAQWTGKGQAGIVLASGNSTSKSGSVKLALTDVSGPWTHKLGFAAVYASTDVGTTSQRWEALEQSNYNYSDNNFVFAGVRYENDRFSGFDYQATLSTGLGHLFLKNDTDTLSGQFGVGYKSARTRNPVATESSVAGIATAFNAATTLSDKFTLEVAADNTFLQNEVAVEVKMSDRLALAVAFQVRQNSNPPPAFKKLVTLTTLNVVYEIK
jgi:putative salt-induced outer membrane protein